ncbi:GntR family transcriptional regulator [Stygiolobus caldivivus]|uniref:GntR family transcriptional regulator n=1 Tax=Stygiolobus caldivivus TaxID=2824673 RepID=A0A8D5ZF39_9CREN|nr:GntR family transcriptional regulator [Stygiolobus caldivivus]BCU70033.1 GntR family transcriptional regulator [Stygiolobus caldivivus]
MSNLTETAYNKILSNIVNGKYRQGQRLTEDQLCKDLNMSRTPVREALRMLLSEGVIKKENKSYSVVYITAEEVRMLYEVRIPLEGLAARLASLRASEEDIINMERTLFKVKEELEKGDPDPLTLAQLNGAFHEAIANAARNTYLRSYLTSTRVKLKIVRTSLFTSFERRAEEYDEHYSVFTAIKEREPEEAERLMVEHEKRVLDYLEKRVLVYMS